MNMTLSEYIKNYRLENKISQRQLAADCSLSTGYISLIEKEYNPQTGKKMIPTLEVLNKLAKGMKMPLDELLSSCDDMQVTLSKEEKIIAEHDVSAIKRKMIDLILSLPDEKIELLYKISQAALEL